MNKEYEHVKDFLGTEKVPDQPLKERTIEDVHKEVISKHLKGLRRNYEMNEIKEKPKVDEKPSQKPIEKVEKTSKERPEDTSTGLSEKTIYDKEMEMLKEELSKVKKKRK